MPGIAPTIDFSLVCLSRGRINLLTECLTSIKTLSKLNYEVIVGCDIDDDLYIDCADDIQHGFPFVQLIFKTRPDNLHDYLNFLARAARGKYIFGINDDCYPVTDGWDVIAKEKLDSFGDYSFGKVYDDSIDKVGDYGAAPIISKKAIDKLGFFMYNGYRAHGSDVVTYRIYEQAGKVVDLTKDVHLHHVMHASPEALQKRMQDKTAVEMINKTFEHGFDVSELFKIDITKYADLLKQ